MRRIALLCMLLLSLNVFAGDPSAALAAGKKHLAAKEYRQAVEVLQPAVADAAAIPDAKVRSQALAAINFYLAVAHAGAKQDVEARVAINQFFDNAPEIRSVDASKYDARFVSIFREEFRRRNPAEDGETSVRDTFAQYYPEWTAFQPAAAKPADAQAIDAAAVHLMGTSDERREWKAVGNEAERQAFLSKFWAARDAAASPTSPSRDRILRRIAFADQTFGGRGDRGSMSDRGKVFVLLGEPALVRRRPIKKEDNVWLAEDAQINGTIEQWLYRREDLPVTISTPNLTYRFVTQDGVGHGMLQKESAQAMNALAEAAVVKR